MKRTRDQIEGEIKVLQKELLEAEIRELEETLAKKKQELKTKEVSVKSTVDNDTVYVAVNRSGEGKLLSSCGTDCSCLVVFSLRNNGGIVIHNAHHFMDCNNLDNYVNKGFLASDAARYGRDIVLIYQTNLRSDVEAIYTAMRQCSKYTFIAQYGRPGVLFTKIINDEIRHIETPQRVGSCETLKMTYKFGVYCATHFPERYSGKNEPVMNIL